MTIETIRQEIAALEARLDDLPPESMEGQILERKLNVKMATLDTILEDMAIRDAIGAGASQIEEARD